MPPSQHESNHGSDKQLESPREGSTHEGLWRNGSASDSRSEGWEFESLWPHLCSGGSCWWIARAMHARLMVWHGIVAAAQRLALVASTSRLAWNIHSKTTSILGVDSYSPRNSERTRRTKPRATFFCSQSRVLAKRKDDARKPTPAVEQKRLPLFAVAAVAKRHRGDSNPCGQSPMDFESISLAARTQCHVMDGLSAGQQGNAFDFPVAGARGLRKRRSLCDQDIGLWFLSVHEPRLSKSAASETRTHDRRIMRPARCQLRCRRCSCPGIALGKRAPAAYCHEKITAAASMKICTRTACMSKGTPVVRSVPCCI